MKETIFMDRIQMMIRMKHKMKGIISMDQILRMMKENKKKDQEEMMRMKRVMHGVMIENLIHYLF